MFVAHADVGGGVKKTTTSTTTTTKTNTTQTQQGNFWTKIGEQIQENIKKFSDTFANAMNTLQQAGKATTPTTTPTTNDKNNQKKPTNPTNPTRPTTPVNITTPQVTSTEPESGIGTAASKEVIPAEMKTKFNDLKTKWLEYNSNSKYDLDKYYNVLKDYTNQGVADKVDSTLGELDNIINTLDNDTYLNSSTINSFLGIVDIIEGEVLSARRMMTECLIPIEDKIFILKECLIERKKYKDESIFDASAYISKASQIESEIKTAYASYKAAISQYNNGVEVASIAYEEIQADQNYPINKRIELINNMIVNVEVSYSKYMSRQSNGDGVDNVLKVKFSEVRSKLTNILTNLKTLRTQFPLVDLKQLDVNSLDLSGLTNVNSSLSSAINALTKIDEIEQECNDIINSIVKKNEEYPFDLKCIRVDKKYNLNY